MPWSISSSARPADVPTRRRARGGGRSAAGARFRRIGGSRGQATVELALVLPVVVVVALLLVQVSLVGLAQILVVQAARAGARTAAVEADVASVRAAALATPGLRSDRLSVERGPRGSPGSLVSVTVRYRVPTDLPLVGRLVSDVSLTSTAVFQVEGTEGTDGVRGAQGADRTDGTDGTDGWGVSDGP